VRQDRDSALPAHARRMPVLAESGAVCVPCSVSIGWTVSCALHVSERSPFAHPLFRTSFTESHAFYTAGEW